MNKRHFIYSIPIILLLIVAVAGWFATDYLGNKARKEIISESQASALTLSIYVHSTFTTIEGAVKSLSGSPWIAPALLSKSNQDIEHANSALDRYTSALNASVSYLMDANGMTVASSNRKDPDSFVGKSYRFRPYFQEAAKGQPYHYFALGITSGKRGFYASYPIQNRLGKVLGVVTIKKDIDDMVTFFRKYSFCFFISPDGIIFLSSQPEMDLKSFWPLDKTAQEKLIASRQFGNKRFETVTKKEIADGAEVTLEGKNYFVSRKVLGNDGWSIVLLNPTDRIWIYKLIGILATIFAGFLIMVFSGILYLTNRSEKAIRQSDELIKILNEQQQIILDSSPSMIFYKDKENRFIRVNESMARANGMSKEEMEGKTCWDIFPREAAESYWQIDKEVMADGKPVLNTIEEMKTPQGTMWVQTDKIPYRNSKGEIIGIIGFILDITERMKAEEKLSKQAEELRVQNEEMTRFNRVAVGREMQMIELKREINELCRKLGETPRHRIPEAPEEDKS